MAKSKRLPRPAEPIRVRLELSPEELRLIEDAAHVVRLSVASWARVAVLDAAAHLERQQAWEDVAARITAAPAPKSDEPKGKGKGPKKGGGK